MKRLRSKHKKTGRNANAEATPLATVGRPPFIKPGTQGHENITALIPPVGHALRGGALRFLGLDESATDEQGLARLFERFPDRSADDYLGQYDERFVAPRERRVVECAIVDPIPILQEVLTHPGLDADLRSLVEHGLEDPALGLRLLVDDPRLEGWLPRPPITLNRPTPRDNALQDILGPDVLIVEERELRYTARLGKKGEFVARRLRRPIKEKELIPILESRAYQEHCNRRMSMSVDETSTELQRALDGDKTLALWAATDGLRQVLHWRAFKTRAARARKKDALRVIDKIERRFRTFAVGTAGRPRSHDRKRSADPDLMRKIRDKAPDVRAGIKRVSSLLRFDQFDDAKEELRRTCRGLGLSRVHTDEAIKRFIDARTPVDHLLQRPQYVVNQLLAWVHGLRINDVGRLLSAKTRRP